MKILKELTSWPFLIILLCSFTLTYLVSPEWVRSQPGVDVVLGWILNHIPALNAYVSHSRFPDIAYVYFPAMLLISPLHFIFVWRQDEQHQFWRVLFDEKPVRTAFRLLITTALLIIVALITCLWGGEQLDSVPWNDSKLALFLAGHAAAGGAFFGMLGVTLSGFAVLFGRRS
ncbi:hypothetical protein [Noviherbaspirillum saxi]|uniref:Uncharacterized protein n=1 Tax=Noviherbaspirillum saxi TaxID=2320863 RepID=A0A3A3FKD3_9BURK|nr:hypothetical protein [Noviherbaspirillum saxi]RJF95181.1 hypothetical protein D3871_17160 [Noviherbaspirillum saxi]